MRVAATSGVVQLPADGSRVSGLILVPAGVAAPRVPLFTLIEPPRPPGGGQKLSTGQAGSGLLSGIPGGGAGLFGASAGQVTVAASSAGIGVGIFGSVRSKNQ
jgi:hypothetical protein